MKLYIKNMLDNNCKKIVKSVLQEFGLHCTSVNIGHVSIREDISAEQRIFLEAAFLKYGLELIDEKKNTITEKVKNVVIQMIHYSDDELPKTKYSDYISKKLNYNYTYISNTFSEIKGTTVEQYIIAHKIERVKELLIFSELTLSEIAWKLHYSSVGHLSGQFKKVTGITSSIYKKMKQKNIFSF